MSKGINSVQTETIWRPTNQATLGMVSTKHRAAASRHATTSDVPLAPDALSVVVDLSGSLIVSLLVLQTKI